MHAVAPHRERLCRKIWHPPPERPGGCPCGPGWCSSRPTRDPSALRGIEQFSHIWLLWPVHPGPCGTAWSTHRPGRPRLGGNTRVGRPLLPARPFPAPTPSGCPASGWKGWSRTPPLGPVLLVRGADLLDGTPPSTTSNPISPLRTAIPTPPRATPPQTRGLPSEVRCPDALRAPLAPRARGRALAGVMAGDPRPSYQTTPSRVYGMRFAGHQVRFTVADGVLTVCEITPGGLNHGAAQHSTLFCTWPNCTSAAPPYQRPTPTC